MALAPLKTPAFIKYPPQQRRRIQFRPAIVFLGNCHDYYLNKPCCVLDRACLAAINTTEHATAAAELSGFMNTY
jgi:hypothetical protein